MQLALRIPRTPLLSLVVCAPRVTLVAGVRGAASRIHPTLQYENPLTGRYASPEMSRIWSPQTKFSTWRKLWWALAQAERELGLPITAEQVRTDGLVGPGACLLGWWANGTTVVGGGDSRAGPACFDGAGG